MSPRSPRGAACDLVRTEETAAPVEGERLSKIAPRGESRRLATPPAVGLRTHKASGERAPSMKREPEDPFEPESYERTELYASAESSRHHHHRRCSCHRHHRCHRHRRGAKASKKRFLRGEAYAESSSDGCAIYGGQRRGPQVGLRERPQFLVAQVRADGVLRFEDPVMAAEKETHGATLLIEVRGTRGSDQGVVRGIRIPVEAIHRAALRDRIQSQRTTSRSCTIKRSTRKGRVCFESQVKSYGKLRRISRRTTCGVKSSDLHEELR